MKSKKIICKKNIERYKKMLQINIELKKYYNALTILIKSSCIATLFFSFMHLEMFAGSTQYVYLGKEEFEKGKLENVFIDALGRLRLNLGYEKVVTSPAEVVWGLHVQSEKLVLATGSAGKIFIYSALSNDVGSKESLQLLETVDSEADGILSIAEGKNGTLYFGSATQGIVYALPKGGKTLEVIAALGESYVWDVYFDEDNNRLLAAVGGNAGGLYEIALNSSGTVVSAPELMASFQQFNALKIAMHDGEVYVSTSKNGKVYKLLERVVDKNSMSAAKGVGDLSEDVGGTLLDDETLTVQVGDDVIKNIPTTSAGKYEKQVIYDAGAKDVSDYFFISNMLVVATSGDNSSNLDIENISEDGLVGLSESASKEIEKAKIKIRKNTKVSFSNKVVQVHLKTYAQQTLLEVPEKNVLALANMPQQKAVLVAMVENGEVLKLNLKNLETRQLHLDKNVALSALTVKGNKIYFASAKSGEVYALSTHLPKKGFFTSKVYPLNDVTAYGRIGIENYGYEKGVRVSMRSGRTEKPNAAWSAWENFDINEEDELFALEEIPPINSFVQFRFNLQPLATNVEMATEEAEVESSPIISDFLFFYGSRNTPPLISNVVIRGKFQNKMSNGVKPTTVGSFSSKLGIIEKLKSSPQPKSYELTWTVDNADKDIIEYDVFYQKRGEKTWKLLVENHYDNSVGFDNGLFVDGVYRFKVVYNDFLSNGVAEGYEREMLSPYHLVDNSPPVIKKGEVSSSEVEFTVSDALSPVVSLYYSFDLVNYYQLLPVDGIFDNTEEIFLLPLAKLTERRVEAARSSAVDGKQNSPKAISIIIRDISNNYLSTSIPLDEK